MRLLLNRFITDYNALFGECTVGKNAKSIALLLSIVAILRATFGLPLSSDTIYFGSLIISLFFLVYKGGIHFSRMFLALYTLILVNLEVVNIQPVFEPFKRAALFVILTLVISSAIKTDVGMLFRTQLFKYSVLGMIIISIGSFFCFFAGINFMSAKLESITEFDKYASTGGLFSGLASHSMLLGPIAMVSALTFYFLYQKKSSNWYLLFFFISAMSAVMAASRSALLGLVIAIVYNLIAGKVNASLRKRMIKILTVSAIITLPIAGITFKGLINKQETRNEQTDGLNSRQEKFDARINEFKSSPLFGFGFSAVDIRSGDADIQSGRIEPGTSHLAVLSMLGLLGFSVYLAILYKAFANTRRINTIHSRFIFSCFLALFVHAWFEGYVLAAGGFMAYLYWLVIGQCIDCSNTFRMTQRHRQRLVKSRSFFEDSTPQKKLP